MVYSVSILEILSGEFSYPLWNSWIRFANKVKLYTTIFTITRPGSKSLEDCGAYFICSFHGDYGDVISLWERLVPATGRLARWLNVLEKVLSQDLMVNITQMFSED